MKLGIIGTGMIVQEFVQLLPQLPLEEIAIFGRDREKTQQIAIENAIPYCYFDYDELLNSSVDTVYIAISNHRHFEFAEQALRAGKNVILEKPITPTLIEFQQLRALAKSQGKMLFEAVTVHYLPAYLAIKPKLSELGDIKIVSLNYSQYSSRYDRFKSGEILPVFDPRKSGGALVDLNVYNLHFAVGLFGKPQNCTYLANIERGIDTSGIALLEYPQFKVVCIGAKDCSAPIMLSIQGDKGNITIPMPANAMNCFNFSTNNTPAQSHQFAEQHRMLPEFLAFIEMIEKQDFQTAEAMLDISEVVCQLTEQARQQVGILPK